jgi:hypothetical protein
MSRTKTYIDTKGGSIALSELDTDERQLVDTLTAYANQQKDWADYGNYWMRKVGEFYAERGLGRPAIQNTTVYRIAKDLASRLAIEAGLARAPDYRDDLEQLIKTRFRTRREFCEATGLSEDMVSHVLAKRKHLAVDTLSDALGRIGYTLHIAPIH